MADNINVDPGTGVGAVPVACDDVGGILYQTIKIATGADGAAVLISNANPVPISDAGGSLTVDGTVAVSGTVPVSGTVAVTGISSTAPDRGAGATTSQTLRVSIASEQVEAGEYEAVAAGAGTTILGTTGASGDFLSSVIVTPTTTSPGSVGIKDGTNTAITIFAGGASSVSNLVPFAIPIGATSTGGAGGWQIVIGGTGVTVIGIGNFS